jgi:hypothetical protein
MRPMLNNLRYIRSAAMPAPETLTAEIAALQTALTAERAARDPDIQIAGWVANADKVGNF